MTLLQLVVCLSHAVEPTGEVQTLELHAGELKVLVGNEADHGSKRTGYIGIWGLTSLHEPANVFVPQYAGWRRFERLAEAGVPGSIGHVRTDRQNSVTSAT